MAKTLKIFNTLIFKEDNINSSGNQMKETSFTEQFGVTRKTYNYFYFPLIIHQLKAY